MSTIVEDDLVKVYVYPDGENRELPDPQKSDDYVIRKTMLCVECNELLDVEYDSPYAHCLCGTTEWYY